MSLDKSSLLYLRNTMKLIYQSNERDWMGVYITRNNPLTFHHIRKKELGGHDQIENGALLTKASHALIHYLEEVNPDLYLMWNAIFTSINQTKKPISKEMYRLIENLKNETVRFISDTANQRTLKMIKKILK